MKNLFGCLGALIIFPVFVLVLVLFNSWYLQVIYNIGIIPICNQFGLFLPQLGYWVFVLINVVIGAIAIYFKNTDTNDSKNKTVHNVFNKDEFTKEVLNVFSPIISNIITKLTQLLFIYIAFNICF